PRSEPCRRHTPEPAETRRDDCDCAGLAGSAEGIRHVRCVRVALRRRAAQTKRLEKPQECSCKNCRIRRPQQRPAEARLPVCRIDHLLRTYAGNGNGQRSSGKLLSVSRFVEIEVSVALACVEGEASVRF